MQQNLKKYIKFKNYLAASLISPIILSIESVRSLLSVIMALFKKFIYSFY